MSHTEPHQEMRADQNEHSSDTDQSAQNNWFVVHTKSHQEMRAEEQLLNQGFQVYLPIVTREIHGGRFKREPLFSNYLFLANKPSPTQFGVIRSTRGVQGLVRFGTEFAMLEGSSIRALRERELGIAPIVRFQEQQEVRITDGPLIDLDAIYLCRCGVERAMVLLKLLNRSQRIEISERFLTPKRS
ncbi:MAG: transcription termination/antitermination NusG family protein [Pseudomonadota bacterium]